MFRLESYSSLSWLDYIRQNTPLVEYSIVMPEAFSRIAVMLQRGFKSSGVSGRVAWCILIITCGHEECNI